jgi:predicted HTH transcriptional regulator
MYLKGGINIKKLILQGEGTMIDFKKTITNVEKIAKSLVAFANNKGGQLLIGVADDGSIKGVKSEDEEKYMIIKAAHQYCKPAVEPLFEEVYVDDKLVLVVTIAKSDTKPHYALNDNKEWWVYFRVNDKSILASKIIVDVLKKNDSNQGQLIEYTDLEKVLFAHLAVEGRITLKNFSKLTRSSHKKAQKIIVNLILSGVLLPHTSEKEEYFTAIEVK